MQLLRVQVVRNSEVALYRREIAAMRPPAYDCETQDLANGSFGDQRLAEKSEKEVIDSLEFALKQRPTHIRAATPLSFRLKATLTVTEATKMALAPPGYCGETGAANGIASETVDFPPFVVTPTGAVQPGILTATPTVGGTWNASGSYAPEGQCPNVTSFACNGGFAPSLQGPPTATLAIVDQKSALARAEVQLPEIGETGEESCPDGTQHQAYIPLPLIIHQLAANADSIAVPLDGTALRGRFEPLTVADGEGVEHLGPDLPPEDCTSLISPSTSCSTQGSGVRVVITVVPVGG